MISITAFISCQPQINKTNEVKPGAEYIQKHLVDEFEQNNPVWFNSKEGPQLLKEKFDSLMLNDSIFYISAIMDDYYYGYDDNYNCKNLHIDVQLHETLGKYTNDSINDFGEVAAFVMSIKFKLSQSMYDGKDEYMFMYEVINKIPSTAYNHRKPYIEDIDTCIKTNDGPKYFINRYYSDEIISAFIISSKTKLPAHNNSTEDDL